MTDIAKEYSTALFMLAMESVNDSSAAFANALEVISKALRDNPDYAELLSSPGIPKNERLALIDEAFSDTLPDTVVSFFKLLCEHGHVRLFDDCKAEYDALFNEAQKVSVATVTSAVPLTEIQKETLIQKLQALSGHTVDAFYKIDESLFGGVVVEIDDKVLDGSLKRQMRSIKEVIEP